VKTSLRWTVAILLVVAFIPAHAALPQPCTGTETWKRVGVNTWRKHGLPRSQGVTSDGHGWIFSWQGGISRTDDAYRVRAVNTYPLELIRPSINADRTNHLGPTHVGDVDVWDGKLYAPEEDGGQDLGVIAVNDPEFQTPTIALYDAKTLLYTGVSYPVPLSVNADGVPWVAVNGPAGEIYTAEWRNPNDRINVFDMQMNFKRFINLQYPASLGAGFRLNRIQGAKLFGGALYAAVDDDRKSVFKIDIATGAVSKQFSLDPPFPSEMEGLAIRKTKDGALLHILLVVHKELPFVGEEPIAIQFQHWAMRCS
jgi:hypothetical protein